MAFKKAKTSKGYNAEYWRVLEYHTNFNRNDAVVVLGLYKDKATRDSDPDAIVETVQLDLGEDFHTTTANTQDTIKNIKVSEIYKHIKSEAETAEDDSPVKFFADALDV